MKINCHDALLAYCLCNWTSALNFLYSITENRKWAPINTQGWRRPGGGPDPHRRFVSLMVIVQIQ